MTSPVDPASSAPPQRPRPAPRRIEVASVLTLSPRMVRVTFTGEALKGLEWRGPAGHLKLTVPADGSHEAPMPEPDGPRSDHMRTYTPRRIDGDKGELDVDLVLHDHGPAGRWAMRAQPGDRLVMMGPAPGYKVDPEAAWFVLAGDDTALPAIETLLAELPANAHAIVLAEVVDLAEARSLHGRADIDVRWLPRGEDARNAGLPLEAALRSLTFPQGPGRIYVGAESAAVRRIRVMLINERNVEARSVTTRGYWRIGNPDNPDRDFAE